MVVNHAERIPEQDLCKSHSETFFLPMQDILKESTTTKLRIVFDGSAKTSSSYSLNDALLPSPSLYPLLPTVINRFRLHPVGMSSDISKMFREVALLPEEHDWHRFLYREDSGKITDCRMTRLTLGISSSTMALSVACSLAKENGLRFKPAILMVQLPLEEFGLWCSTFSRLCRVTAWILRFVNRVKEKNQTQHPTYLTVLELRAAKTLLLRASQHRSYHDVVSTLRKGKVLPSNHQLSTLAPYLDPVGILRVGGRLQKQS